jgi:hypothetical protein
VIDGVAAGSADADDLDDGAFDLGFDNFKIHRGIHAANSLGQMGDKKED